MVEHKLPKLGAWVRFPSPAPLYFFCVFMISCKFLIPYCLLKKLDNFLEEHEVTNVSSFENVELGFSDDLDDDGFPIAKFFNVEIFTTDLTEAENLKEILKNEFGDDVKNFTSSELKDEDWVELYTKELKPIICEKFYFYNEEIQDKPNNDSLIPVKLNSALAFGSGHHQTTQGCLMNSLFLFAENFKPKNILDMGCGTGILGICTSKIWPDSKLLGIDIDPEAVRITKENFKANDVKADAITDCNVESLKSQKFDLILCNILKQPLIDLCPNFSEILEMGGHIITSGFITSQEKDVVDCYKSNGFEIANRIQIEDWLSILFTKI